jgi:hypothetical protein
MKHILNDLSNEEKNSIRSQHTGTLSVRTDKFKKLVENKLGNAKPLINEDNFQGGGQDAMGRPIGHNKDNVTFDTNKTYNFGKDKMKTGSDVVDTTTKEYKDMVSKFKSSLSNPEVKGIINVEVLGGASAAKVSSSYDNKALAKRRADNLITQIKKDVPGVERKFKFTSLGMVDQTATKVNSPEAYKAQFVKVSFSQPSSQSVKVPTEVDNTAVNIPKIYPPLKNGNDFTTQKIKRVCVQIPEEYLDEYLDKIKEFKLENSLPKVKYGVYDIK